MAQSLLTRLSNPKGTDYRVGVVNTAAEFGVLVSPKGASPVVEYFRGYSTARGSERWLSWTATELLDSSPDTLRFEVIRITIDAQTCPDLEEAVSRFYSELERVLQSQVSLSDLPPDRHPEFITVDGTSYVLQIWTGEGTLAIHPDRDIDLDMDDASRVLLSTISGCSNGLPSVIEEHYA